MGKQPVTRRRGAALEEAILDAAWVELSTKGYPAFTFEAVAKRAGTSRPVLYRRWPTRRGLATAAMVRHIQDNPVVVPDLGNLRDELCLLVRKFADRSPPRLFRLVFDMSDDMAAENDSFFDERFRQNLMEDVIERGVQRGEIDIERLTTRRLRLPLGLAVFEVILTGKHLTDDAIAEIIDQIVLPLITPVRAVAAR